MHRSDLHRCQDIEENRCFSNGGTNLHIQTIAQGCPEDNQVEFLQGPQVRKSKRNFEHKLAQNIKSDSKSFYAYVRSKQNVRDKVGPLEDNAGNNNNTGIFNGRGIKYALQFSVHARRY